MANRSAPPNPSDDNSPNSEPAAQAVGTEPQVNTEAPKDNSPKSAFVNSQPIREDQVQNAVNFLSHPRVRGSPVVHRRNFLERKGLTKEEIDEAFRRVPDPSPAVANSQATSTYQDGQPKPSANIQQQAPAQALQPAAAAPSGVLSTVTRRFHWTHALLAVGFLAVSGAGTAIIFKNAFIPRLKTWIRKVVSDDENGIVEGPGTKPSLAEEAAAAAKAAAAAAADVAKASQEMLTTKNEEKRCFQEFMNVLDVQLQEIKSMKNSIRKLEGSGQTYGTGRSSYGEEDYRNGSIVRKESLDAKAEFDKRSVRSTSPRASNEPPHPKSYMEIMAMVQRGERPPNIRDIDDRPPNPDQPISNPSLAPRSKPWEVGHPQSNSFGSSSAVQDNGTTYHFNNDTSAPWWQPKSSRITEIENEDTTATADRPLQRKWVPPQPPPVSMPEAAAAIRQLKASIPKDVSRPGDDDVARPVQGEEADELERITRISESGGQVEMNGGRSETVNTSEIQELATEV